jgi:hypothetical protein
LPGLLPCRRRGGRGGRGGRAVRDWARRRPPPRFPLRAGGPRRRRPAPVAAARRRRPARNDCLLVPRPSPASEDMSALVCALQPHCAHCSLDLGTTRWNPRIAEDTQADSSTLLLSPCPPELLDFLSLPPASASRASSPPRQRPPRGTPARH